MMKWRNMLAREDSPVADSFSDKQEGGGLQQGTMRNTGPHHFEMESWISPAPFERLLNMDILEASEGRAVLTMPFLLDFSQGAGLMHGGALVSLADTAVAMAVKSLVPPQTHFATISLETKFLRPVKQGMVTAKAEVFSQEGRTLEGRAVVYDEGEKATLEFASTFKIARNSFQERKTSQECKAMLCTPPQECKAVLCTSSQNLKPTPRESGDPNVPA